MTDWRLLREDSVSAAAGLAADDAITGRVGRRASPATLRLYTYRSHCALVGLFQDVDHEVEVDGCRRLGVEINRRPTGGGAILMGEDQLGIALMLPARGPGTHGRPRELMQRFARGLIAGLASAGLSATFRGKNDLAVGGRKIAGLGVHRHPGGGLLFHGSLLVDLDVPRMVQVLRTPFEKITEEEVRVVSRRTATVRGELSRDVSMEEVRDEIAGGFAAAFDVALVPGALEDPEIDEVAALEQQKYGRDEWVYRTQALPPTTGVASVRTLDGSLRVHVARTGGTIQAVSIRGDFFASERALAEVEGCLRWHPADPDAIRATVRDACERSGADWEATAPDALVQAILTAAGGIRPAAARETQGCFVNPEGAGGRAGTSAAG